MLRFLSPLIGAFAALSVFAVAAPARAQDDLVRVESAYPAAQTLDRLSAAVEKAGATVFARIDHANGAESIGETLAPTQVLIFGNPKIGTAPIAAARTAGLDLPLRVLAYEDAEGKSWLVYRDPAAFAAAHSLPADHPNVKMMAGALGKLTAAAAR